MPNKPKKDTKKPEKRLRTLESENRKIWNGRPKKWKTEDIEKLADDILEFVQDPNVLVFGEVCQPFKVSLQDMIDFERTNEKFRKAKMEAMSIIGMRREKLALLNKADSAIVRKAAPLYDPYMKAWELQLKNLDSNGSKDALRMVVRGIREEEKDKPKD